MIKTPSILFYHLHRTDNKINLVALFFFFTDSYRFFFQMSHKSKSLKFSNLSYACVYHVFPEKQYFLMKSRVEVFENIKLKSCSPSKMSISEN